jgi:hypothetical protein
MTTRLFPKFFSWQASHSVFNFFLNLANKFEKLCRSIYLLFAAGIRCSKYFVVFGELRVTTTYSIFEQSYYMFASNIKEFFYSGKSSTVPVMPCGHCLMTPNMVYCIKFSLNARVVELSLF